MAGASPAMTNLDNIPHRIPRPEDSSPHRTAPNAVDAWDVIGHLSVILLWLI
jgi:hypothetical protein